MVEEQSVDVLSLIGSQKAEFNHAARLRTWVLRVQVTLAALTGATVFIATGSVLYIAAALALSLTAVWLFLALELGASRSHAERLRRATMIAGGLGVPLDGAEMLELANEGKASKAEAKRLIDPEYFASSKPPGLSRFIDMLEESAIWTANISGIAAKEAWYIFGGGLSVFVFAVIVGFTFMDPTRWEVIARAIFAMIAVLLSADFLGAAVNYGRAKQSVTRVIDRLQRCKGDNPELGPVMVAFGDYNSAVESMPLFSNGLYDRHKKHLNEQYKMFLTGPQ